MFTPSCTCSCSLLGAGASADTVTVSVQRELILSGTHSHTHKQRGSSENQEQENDCESEEKTRLVSLSSLPHVVSPFTTFFFSQKRQREWTQGSKRNWENRSRQQKLDESNGSVQQKASSFVGFVGWVQPLSVTRTHNLSLPTSTYHLFE